MSAILSLKWNWCGKFTRPEQGLKSVPKIPKKCPINAILVYFVLAIIFGELSPLVFSYHSIIKLKSLIFLA